MSIQITYIENMFVKKNFSYSSIVTLLVLVEDVNFFCCCLFIYLNALSFRLIVIHLFVDCSSSLEIVLRFVVE